MKKLLTLCVLGLSSVGSLMANHPVFVEGNCLVPPAGTTPTPAPTGGTCGDYDGDGRIGTAEDTDGDRVFGTITAALANATGANQNGQVTIVTSGVFAEVVRITGANGNVTLEAAPGVRANIDAVLQGDPGSGGRQNAPGIVVNSPADRYVILRNLQSRNWTSGIRVMGNSRVAIINCDIEGNTNFGIEVMGNARVKIDQSHVLATGFRVGGGMDFPRVAAPNPGDGISFVDSSSGAIFRTEVTGSFRNGIVDRSGGRIQTRDVYLFDNGVNSNGVDNDFDSYQPFQ